MTTRSLLARGPARLARAAVARPGPTVLAACLLVLAAAPGLARLELRTDGHALVPPDDPVVQFDAEVRERFGLRDPIVVMVESDHPDGIYNPATLRRLRDLSAALADLEWVDPGQVKSLATEHRDRVYPGTLRFRPFLDPLPDTPERIAVLRSDLDAAGLLYGTLVAADGRAATILVGVPAGRADVARGAVDRRSFHRDVAALADRFEGGHDRLSVLGAPVAEALLGEHVLADLALLLPLVIAVLAVVIWLACGRLWGVVLALLQVGGCLVWTFGLMGWVGAPIYLTTAILPVILVTIGLADQIHVVWHYQRLLAVRDGGSVPAPVTRTLDEMAAPVTLTSMTTAIGFLAFVASPIAPVSSFGAFAAAGIGFCWLWTFTALPALLGWLAPERLARPARRGSPGRRLRALVTPLVRRRRWTLAAVGAVSLVTAAGLPRVTVQDGWIQGFAPDDPFRRATERLHEHFAGSHLLLAHLSFEPAEEVPRIGPWSGPLLDPRRLEAIGRFEAEAAALAGVGGVLGPHSYLSTVAFLAGGRRLEDRGIPPTPRGVARVIRRFDLARGEQRRREVISDDLAHGVVTVFLKEANFQDTAALMDALRSAAEHHLAPWGGRLDFAGDVAVSQSMIPAIVHTQVRSLLLALVGSLAAVTLVHRSLGRGSLAVLPATLVVLWTFGAMGWGGMPLGVATSLFCAITLGIGVDYAVHLLARIRRAREAGEVGPDAVLSGVEEAGPAIVADAVAVAAGFGLLALSQVPATASLGILVSGALLAGCAAVLGGLAPLVAGGQPDLRESPYASERPSPGAQRRRGAGRPG